MNCSYQDGSILERIEAHDAEILCLDFSPPDAGGWRELEKEISAVFVAPAILNCTVPQGIRPWWKLTDKQRKPASNKGVEIPLIYAHIAKKLQESKRLRLEYVIEKAYKED